MDTYTGKTLLEGSEGQVQLIKVITTLRKLQLKCYYTLVHMYGIQGLSKLFSFVLLFQIVGISASSIKLPPAQSSASKIVE